MALILTTTGISLLAYSDGVTVRSTTLSAVLIASASAAGSAVYKVMFKKVMGCVTFSQVTKTKMAYNLQGIFLKVSANYFCILRLFSNFDQSYPGFSVNWEAILTCKLAGQKELTTLNRHPELCTCSIAIAT